mgnify:CR=1 FL=1
MILAAGLTPAWQRILRFGQLQLGEVNRAVEAYACASGKVINVGLALHALEASQAKTLALIGGETGDAIEREFAQSGVTAGWVPSSRATRVCTTLLEDNGRTTELVENAAPASAEELEAFAAAYREEASSAAVAVLTGSLPQGTPREYYRQLLDAAAVPTVADIRGPELMAMLAAPQPPLVVKPNREELAATLGRPLTSDDELLAGMRQLNAAGAPWVVITQGARAVWATSRQAAYRLQPPTLPVVNPIGCGDCMAAGIAWGIAQGWDVPDAVRLGIAAAGDNVTQLLPARIDRQRVEHLTSSVVIERLDV